MWVSVFKIYGKRERLLCCQKMMVKEHILRGQQRFISYRNLGKIQCKWCQDSGSSHNDAIVQTNYCLVRALFSNKGTVSALRLCEDSEMILCPLARTKNKHRDVSMEYRRNAVVNP